jgi:DNA polymerase-1
MGIGGRNLVLLNGFDAEKMGARCDLCILREMREGGPVAPEYHDESVASVIAETPGEKECAEDRPLVGPPGIEFTEVLKKVGYSRKQIDIHHAVACRPPESDLDKVMLKWQRGNKKREAEGREPVPSPIECCRPRLIAELAHPNVITLGKVAYQSLTRAAKPIFDIRGGPVEAGLDKEGNFLFGQPGVFPLKVLPTLHPGMVQRMRRWMRAFQTDLSRAFRFFGGKLLWSPPDITRNPTPHELDAWIRANAEKTIVYDVETTIDDPTEAKLKCVGLSTEDSAMVVHLLSIEGVNGMLIPVQEYTDSDVASLRGTLRDFFINPHILKAGHNAGYFDRMVIEQHFGVTPAPLIDTILVHRSVESELPHKLGYVGSIYTDVTAWKEGHTAKTAATDEELGIYCGIDCVVTARALPKLADAAQLRGQSHVVSFDHKVQAACVGMHHVGMLVDRQRRDEESIRLKAGIEKWIGECRRTSGKPSLNPNSTYQLRDLLFSSDAGWGLTPTDYTKLGDPSTKDEALRAMRTQNLGNTEVTAFLDALRKFRTFAKEYGTYVRRLVPSGQPLDGNRFQTEEEAEESERGLILSDGRVRPDYNAHGTTSGRLSSSNPNAQNWPKHLRGMVVAQPGHVLIGADADQLELRIIASVAGMRQYLDVFDEGGDPHALTASLMFGANFDNAEPQGDQWTKLRNLAKGIKYASFYGSGDETVHGIVTSAEDKEGNLLYPNLSVREVSVIRRNWLKGIPELPRWWEDTMDEYRNTGYIIDPVLMRRRDFLDGEAFNEIVNFPIQSAGAHIIHYSTFDLLKDIPFNKWGPGTGLICQVHDALYVEAPCPHGQFQVPNGKNGKPDEKLREFGWCPPGCNCEANWAAKKLEKVMNRAVPGLDGVKFKSKAKIGLRWSDV